MSRPGTRKSASFASTPRSSSRTAPPTTYASKPSDPTYSSTRLDECDRLDLDERAGGQLRDLDGGAGRRRITDVLDVHLVHAREVVEVLQEDRRLDDPVERAARRLEDRPQVREHLLGLTADLVGDHLGVVGTQRELAGDEHESVRLDRLRVRRALKRRRCSLGTDHFLAHGSSLQAWPSAAPTAL